MTTTPEGVIAWIDYSCCQDPLHKVLFEEARKDTVLAAIRQRQYRLKLEELGEDWFMGEDEFMAVAKESGISSLSAYDQAWSALKSVHRTAPQEPIYREINRDKEISLFGLATWLYSGRSIYRIGEKQRQVCGYIAFRVLSLQFQAQS